MARFLAGKADPDFTRLLGAQFIAQAADGFAQAVAFEVLVLDPFSQGTPGRILAIAALTLLPYSFVAPFLGVFVDRWPRRNILAWTSYGRAALLIAFPLWALAAPDDSELYAAVFLLLGAGRLFLTAKGASLPVVAHEHHLLRANALSSGGGMVSALLGGVVGVLGAGAFGTKPSFIVAGLLYAASGLVAARISRSLDHDDPHAANLREAIVQVARDLLDGIKAIARRAPARFALLGIFFLRTIAMIVVIGAILVIKTEFPDAGDRYGRLAASALALGAAGAGAFLGATTAPVLGRRFREVELILAGYVVSAAGIITLGGIYDVRAVLALTFIGGYGGFITKVAVDAQLQESLPDEYRGRAFALYDILYNLATVAAALVILAADSFRLRGVLTFTGLVTLALAAGLASIMPRGTRTMEQAAR
ncbi:MAG: MFS transporter [Actinomycetota bacterium]|nr:MFS transporter [Actinomycetota bacterium]